jgi:hypothetical protein
VFELAVQHDFFRIFFCFDIGPRSKARKVPFPTWVSNLALAAVLGKSAPIS